MQLSPTVMQLSPIQNKQSLYWKDVKYGQENKYGQILIVTKKSTVDPLDPNLKIDIRLKTGRINDLKTTYGIELPTSGVKLTQKLENLLQESSEKHTSNLLRDLERCYQFRQLLVARKMSQLVAKTWLYSDQFMTSEDKEKFPIIRKLIMLGNQPPKIDELDAKMNLLENLASKYRLEEESEVILPGRMNWQSISLNLLLAGQAYLEKEDGTLSLLHEPILSTFEAVNLYAFKLDFEGFVAKSQELFSPGVQPVPPYYLWTFPYPQRSRTDEFSMLTEQMIEAWAYAEDDAGDLPFYKKTSNAEIKGVEYVYPPYPYMAGSH